MDSVVILLYMMGVVKATWKNAVQVLDPSSPKLTKFQLQSFNHMNFPLKNAEYLPEVFPDTANPAIANASTILESQLSYLGGPNCSSDLGRSLSPRLVEFGFGSTVHSLVKPVMHALKYGYCLADPHGLSRYNCSSWDSLFRSFKSQDGLAATTSKSTVSKIVDNTGCASVFENQNWDDDIPGEFVRCLKLYSRHLHGNDSVPNGLESKGLFFTVSNILRFLVRPSKAVEAEIERTKKRIGWPTNGEKVLGLHFRRGDSCLEHDYARGRKCDNFPKYMEEVRRLAMKYDIKHIYLATDSETILDSVKTTHPLFTFLVDEKIQRGGKRKRELVDKALSNGDIDGCKEGHRVRVAR
ncbi:hypothetical protein AAMO2058_001616800 [Amorphochlora amoebiformis]